MDSVGGLIHGFAPSQDVNQHVARVFSTWKQEMGLSENRLNPILPNGFADHYPVSKWLFHWECIPHFQTYPLGGVSLQLI